MISPALPLPLPDLDVRLSIPTLGSRDRLVIKQFLKVRIRRRDVFRHALGTEEPVRLSYHLVNVAIDARGEEKRTSGEAVTILTAARLSNTLSR